MSRNRRFDDAVVGAGILGLAHAYHLARRGRKVVVFERDGRARGASVLDFGVLWPIGQPAGPLRRMAMRSREVWLEVLGVNGLWHERAGSLHLAYHDDEAAVLREFADRANEEGFRCEWLTPDEVRKRSQLVKPRGLLAGLYSHWEVCLDPSEVMAGLPVWLAKERSVRFEFGREVIGFDAPRVRTTDGDWTADRLWVCAGDDLLTLYPEALAALGLLRGSVRMLRTAPLPDGLRVGPMLADGLTPCHTKSFEGCPGLAALRDRVRLESPELDRLGVHVTATRDGPGGLTIGGPYETGGEADPPDVPAIDRLILDDLGTFLDVIPEVTSRWRFTFAKHPSSPYCVVKPAPSVAAVTGVGGSGMTLSFGLAEYVVDQLLGGD